MNALGVSLATIAIFALSSVAVAQLMNMVDDKCEYGMTPYGWPRAFTVRPLSGFWDRRAPFENHQFCGMASSVFSAT
jgi:hypothetical protein